MRCMIASSFLGKAQLRLIYVAGWTTLCEREGAISSGVGCPTRVLPGPASVRASPPAEVKSHSSGPWHRLTRPWSCPPSPCQGMAPFSSCPVPRCTGGGPLTELAGSLLLFAGQEVGRLVSAATRFVVAPASSAGLPSLRLAAEGTRHDSSHRADVVVVRPARLRGHDVMMARQT
jgi:hypothetical protein